MRLSIEVLTALFYAAAFVLRSVSSFVDVLGLITI
jgi:hypothetical protein